MSTTHHDILRERVIGLFRDTMPFHDLLGIQVKQDKQQVYLQCPWKDALTGNPYQKILHGGVTGSLLDTIGGLTAALQAVSQTQEEELIQLEQRLATMGTIDMRVDYLRPGRGQEFIATAEVIRSGAKVAVCRMELHNERNDHIAFGTGTYMLG
ncbi:thioesterase family protein [Alteromonas halophila]|uniref:Thioesterase domain-containing protein n=1 Tax=Alteromonas halophila TaxID=516698 RepID=A0A918JK01_9ALTE|nr:thioesterase family protein [Alteromonas halophila]GGW84329.1 hypothetical protein GCM10007391_17560 [Alteromonas halophila]